MSTLITICARGGSKGIPGKNIKDLNGKPLLHYTLNTAQAFANLFGADIQLSTDNDAIDKCAGALGHSTEYRRPDELATDTAGKIDAIRDALHYAEKINRKKYDFVIDLDVTSPLRTVEDLRSAFDLLKADPLALNIFSVSPASRNPYFNMVEQKGNGYFNVVKPPSIPIKSRQTAPMVYDMNASFYVYKRAFFDVDGQSIAKTDHSMAYVVDHVCFDLDEPIDFEIMEFLVSNNKLGFTF